MHCRTAILLRNYNAFSASDGIFINRKHDLYCQSLFSLFPQAKKRGFLPFGRKPLFRFTC